MIYYILNNLMFVTWVISDSTKYVLFWFFPLKHLNAKEFLKVHVFS